MINERLTDEIWPTPSLVRAARGLVGIDQGTLAQYAGVSRKAVVTLEGDDSDTMDSRRLDVLHKLRSVFEDRFEIVFIRASGNAGEGLRRRRRKPAAAPR